MIMKIIPPPPPSDASGPASRGKLRAPVTILLPLIGGLVLAGGTGRAEDVWVVGDLLVVDETSPPVIAEHPRAAWNQGEDFAVVWRDNFEDPLWYDCLIRVFNIDGGNWSQSAEMNSRIGSEEVRSPDLAPSYRGYIVSFSDDSSNDEGLFDVYAAGATKDGTNEFPQGWPINHPIQGVSVTDPRIGGDGDNLFLVAWGDARYATQEPPNLQDIYVRRVNAKAEVVDATDFYVNDLFFDTFARSPVVAANDDGDHLVVWSDDRVQLQMDGGQLTSRFDIYCRIVPRTFVPTGDNSPSTPSHAVSAAEDAYPTDALLPWVAYGGGFFVVAWEDGGDIYARALDSDGVPLYTEFPVNDPPGGAYNAVQPSVVHFGAGRFAVTWRDSRDGGSIRVSMYEPGRHVFLSDDLALLINVKENAFPASAATNLGRYLAVWQGPTDDPHIFGHLFDFWKLGDLTGEGIIDSRDFLRFSITWNPDGTEPVDFLGDIDGDGVVDADDVVRLLQLMREDREALRKPVPAPRKTLSPEAYGVRGRKIKELRDGDAERRICRPSRAIVRRR